MTKFFNTGLHKDYEGYNVDGILYFTKEIAQQISKDIKRELIKMPYIDVEDCFMFIDRENFTPYLSTKYKGRNIVVDGVTIHAYPIGCDWLLWDF